MNYFRTAFKPSPSRGGLGGDGVALATSGFGRLGRYCMNTIPTQTLPLKGWASEHRVAGGMA